MAITNAQQYKQLVNPPLDGKRPGYRGDAAARSTGAAQSGRADPGERGDPGEGANRGGFSAPTRGEPAFTSPDRFVEIDQDVINREKEYRDFIQAYNKKPPFVGPAASILRNIIPGNTKLRSQFINQKLQNERIKDFYENLSDDEKNNFEVMQALSAVGYDQYAADMGSPGLLYSGNVGNLEKFITGKDAFGNTTYGYKEKTGDGGGGDNVMSDYERRLLELENQLKTQQAAAPTTTQNPFAYRFMADGGIMNADIVGGMMDGNIDEMGRQMYGLGKLVKKATRAVKKVAKSPIGKAALLYGLGAVGGSFGNTGKLFSKGMFSPGNISRGLFGITAKGQALRGFPELAAKKGLFGQLGLTGGYGGLMPTLKGGLALASLAPLVFQGDEEEENFDPYRGPDIDIDAIRRDPYGAMGGAYRFAADGGIMRSGYQEGGDAEPVAKKTMPLIDMDGKEKDYRETGGFVDMGRMERADDVPARLSKNEFVFTADAVRNAGEGDIDKGAEVMYNMMKNLEAGGEVSEESQGLEGARNMFQTSQRLEEVL
jgi:hypothetical protein